MSNAIDPRRVSRAAEAGLELLEDTNTRVPLKGAEHLLFLRQLLAALAEGQIELHPPKQETHSSGSGEVGNENKPERND